MPEPLPETGVLANHSLGKFERNDRKNERMTERMNDTHSGFLILDFPYCGKFQYIFFTLCIAFGVFLPLSKYL